MKRRVVKDLVAYTTNGVGDRYTHRLLIYSDGSGVYASDVPGQCDDRPLRLAPIAVRDVLLHLGFDWYDKV